MPEPVWLYYAFLLPAFLRERLSSSPIPIRTRGSQPTRFIVVAGKHKFSVPAHKLPDGTVCLKFDLAKLPDGEYTVHVRAIDDHKHWESNSTSVKLTKNGNKVTYPPPPPPPEKTAPVKVKISPSRVPGGLLKQPE